jgi:hypothetical protein
MFNWPFFFLLFATGLVGLLRLELAPCKLGEAPMIQVGTLWWL